MFSRQGEQVEIHGKRKGWDPKINLSWLGDLTGMLTSQREPMRPWKRKHGNYQTVNNSLGSVLPRKRVSIGNPVPLIIWFCPQPSWGIPTFQRFSHRKWYHFSGLGQVRATCSCKFLGLKMPKISLRMTIQLPNTARLWLLCPRNFPSAW